ncbi:MAG: dihydropteroate synthase [Deltaproteobacteria bacterium]|nr:dihydropteroate synthase [Deltaproteobacteria bacterium]
MITHEMCWGNHRLDFNNRTLVMGVLNVTPDSFSDGGRFFSPEDAIAQGEKMAADGADILDIGGESTRPFSDPVNADEEIHRVVPVIKTLAKRVKIPISIDTTKAATARSAIAAGAAIINDVGALKRDPHIADVAAEAGVPVILMHMKETPRTMQVAPVYDDLITEISDFLQQAADRAVRKGISHSKIIIDPGIGFGKTLTHNCHLLRNLTAFGSMGYPILIGTSRKRFLRDLIKDGDLSDSSPALQSVETATHASVAAAAMNGAHIVRVHDVAGARVTLTIIDAINYGPLGKA